jgi:predicted nucleic acid-binding Zn ribbon protein
MLMRTVLAFVGAAAVAVLFWLLRGSSDATILAAKDAQIAAMQETVRVKDHLASAQSGTLDARNTSIKEFEAKLKSAEDQLAKDQAQLDAGKAELQRVKTADETIINSLKGDNNADIQALKEQIEEKDQQIAQLNEKLVQTIAEYEGKLSAIRNQVASESTDDDTKIYPLDDGFEQQDLGAGMFAYQVFSQLNNPTNAPQPQAIPNHTPWTFGGTGNSGISANGAFYVSNARNSDHDGKTSQTGQVAFLQFKGSWFSQKIKLPAGTFSISFDFESRRDYEPANGIAVSLDGTDLFVGAPTDTNNFAHVTSNTITLKTSKECELKFRGLGALNDPGGDHTTFIDNVCINVVGTHRRPERKFGDNGAAINPLPDADPDKNAIYPKDSGFDAQDLGVGFFAYQNFGEFHNPNHVPQPTPVPNQTPWKFGPSAGVAANGSGFYVTNATNGDSDGKKSTGGQAGFLTLNGSSISQSLHLKAGTYVVVFGLEARRDYVPNHISVMLGGKTVFEGVPVDTNNFQQVVTAPVSLPKDGDFLLKFCGHGGNGKLDGDAFIDDVRIRPVAPSAANDSTLHLQDALTGIRQ